MKKRYTEKQIIGFLKQADVGLPVKRTHPPIITMFPDMPR